MNIKILRCVNRAVILDGGMEDNNKPFKINGEIWKRIIEKFPMNVKSTIRVLNENLVLKTSYDNGVTITIKLIDGNKCKIIIDSKDDEMLENVINAVSYDISYNENEYGDITGNKSKTMYISFIERAMNDCIVNLYKKRDIKKFIIESLFDNGGITLTGKGIQLTVDKYQALIGYLASRNYDVDDITFSLGDDLDLSMLIQKEDMNNKPYLSTIYIVNKNETQIDDAIISASSNKVELEEFNKIFNTVFGNVEMFPSYFTKLLVKWLPYAKSIQTK